MNELLWLIDQDYYEGETEALKAAIEAEGMTWKQMSREDYYMDRLGRGVPDNQPCIAICTLQVGKKLRRLRPALTPGVVCDLEKLKCSWYYPRVGRDLLLNDKCVYVPWAELPRMLPELTDIFTSTMFIRPDKGDKGFSGTTMSAWPGELEQWLKKDYEFADQFMSAEDMVLVAPPCMDGDLHQEYRTFVVGGKVVTGTLYKEDGKSKHSAEVPDGVMQFAQSVADVLGSQMEDFGYVVDVALGDNGDMKVIELNSLSCSGMYAADPRAIVRAVAEQVALRPDVSDD